MKRNEETFCVIQHLRLLFKQSYGNGTFSSKQQQAAKSRRRRRCGGKRRNALCEAKEMND